MSVNDVWRRIDKQLGVYLKGSFDQIPKEAGVYAWFYPIKVSSYDLNELLRELSQVSNYDAKSGAHPAGKNDIEFNWKTIKVYIEEGIRFNQIPSPVYGAWDGIVNNEEKFLELRKALMSASILMPPLYIGKTINLRNRCSQHLKGGSDEKSGFHQRFEKYAEDKEFTTRKVEDLIFVCIRTQVHENQNNYNNAYDNPHSIVEEILKATARPPYGVK